MRKVTLGLLISIWILFFLVTPVSALAATPPAERSLLTIELLQERLKSPVQSEGVRTIDLSQLIINLRPENAEFRDQFYQLLQTQLNRSTTPLGVDFSHSVIQGDFVSTNLTLRTSLYGEALSPLLTPQEQQQLLRDPRRLSQPTPVPLIPLFRGPLKLVQTRFTGTVNFVNTFFLHRVEANGAIFSQEAEWSGTRWTRLADFADATFSREVNFCGSLFFAKAGFSRVRFRGVANFQGSTFERDAIFSQAQFEQLANLTRTTFGHADSLDASEVADTALTRSPNPGQADFTQATWHDRALFSKSQFTQSLLLTEATFEKAVAFRETQFNQLVNMRAVSLLEQVDFSNARFFSDAYLNVAGLTFDSNQAKIFGDSGEIGHLLSVPMLQGNEDVLRNLVRNFRSMQQIADANQIEYTTQRLRRQQLGSRLMGRSFLRAGKSERTSQGYPLTGSPSHRVTLSLLPWILEGFYWLGLSLLLLLSRYGTSFWLVFGVGMVAIAYFGLLFWLVDRFRRRHPQLIVPSSFEMPWMLGSYGILTCAGVTAIFRTSDQPWLTLACLGGVILPVPMLLLWRLYKEGRYHDLMDVSYFVEDGSLRQLRLLIGRLPVMPRFEIFRDRYMPILWNRHWNWLNYYDFSLNNLLKIGFNDIRLRDEHLPGIITTLVWYQWSLGILYIALLLWTLSRTIPGLNLLIYLK
ncbi:MAG TPA: low-complexity protein [Cyanobacteria bacterium UBA8543]|nr:low-complexity protein [Cyanobacteria bacterium UBA8543]